MHKPNIVKPFTLLLLGFFIGWGSFSPSLASTSPKWFENKTPSNYPISEFIIGFGKASSSKEALTLAQSEIAAQLETTIQTSTSIIETETKNGTTYNVTTKHETELSSLVQKTLRGVDVIKREKKDGTVYLMAALSKKTFTDSLEKDINALKSSLETRLKKAKIEELKLNIDNALELYKESLPLCKEYYANLTLFNAISEKKLSSQIPNVSDIQSLRDEIANGISLKIKSGNYQTAEPATSLESPIVFELTYKNRPLENINISMYYSDGTLIKEEKTDQEGEVAIEPMAIPFELQKTYITASTTFSTLTPKEIENIQVSAYYSLAFSALTQLQLIPINEPSEKALSKLSNLIESYGITWNPESPFVIEAELDPPSITTLSGAIIPQYIATLTWTLKIRLQNGNPLGTMQVRGRGIHKSREKAELEAYEKLDLSKTMFYNFLSKIAKTKAGA